MSIQHGVKPSLVFMGTPEFAVPSLKALVACQAYQVRAVITQPDKPAGRGRKLTSPAVKHVAEQLGLHVLQPASLVEMSKSEQWQQIVHSPENLDCLVVVAYGKIIPLTLMNQARIGAVNVHPSLLPRFRGAAPLQHTIFSGDRSTGVSLMKLDQGLDTGPVYVQQKIELQGNETFGALHDRLADMGAKMLVQHLPSILSGAMHPTAQFSEGVTYADKWEAEDLNISWNEPTHIIEQRIRASFPEPGARTEYKGQILKIYSTKPVANKNYPSLPPGSIVEANQAELVVSTGDGFLSILELQLPGRKRLAVSEVMRGFSFQQGERFTVNEKGQ